MSRSVYHRLVSLLRNSPPYARVLVLLWALLILPAAFCNALFPMDFGGIFQVASRPDRFHWILSPYNGSGRYFPVYWLYHTLLVTIWSANVKPYYVVQSAMFLISTILTGMVFARLSKGRLVAVLLMAALMFSSPNAETLYTVGKTEPLVYFFIIQILALFSAAALGGRRIGAVRWGVMSILFALAIWSKETSVSLFVFAVTGAAVAWALNRVRRSTAEGSSFVGTYLRFFLCLCCGFAISRVPYLVYVKERATDTAYYTTYAITVELVLNNARFYVLQQPDVIGFGVLAAALLLWIGKRAIADTEGAIGLPQFTFVAAAVGMGWSYVAIFLVWRWPLGYYLFVPSILFRFAAFYGVWAASRAGLLRHTRFAVAWAFIGMMLLYSSVYLWYIGSSQVAYSKVYTAALKRYLASSSDGEGLIIESYPFFAEQIGATEQLFSLALHARRHVYGIADWANPAVLNSQIMQLLRITDEQLRANEAVFPKQGDYVLAMTGDKLGWDLRGVSPYYSSGSDLNEDGAYLMNVVAQDRYYNWAAFADTWTLRPTLRPTYVGYKLYRVVEGPRFRWFGRYPDGWTAAKARLTLYPPYCSRAVLHLSTSRYTPSNVVRVFRNDSLVETVTLSSGREQNLELAGGDTPTVFRFEIEHTFVPKNIRLNADPRELGILTRLEPFGGREADAGRPEAAEGRVGAAQAGPTRDGKARRF